MATTKQWINDNLGENAQRSKGFFEEFASDTTSASWGCNQPIINGYKFAWITKSPLHKGDKPVVYYDYIKV